MEDKKVESVDPKEAALPKKSKQVVSPEFIEAKRRDFEIEAARRKGGLE